MIDFTNTTTIILIIVLFSLIIIYITWNKCIYLCKLENIGLESSNTKGNTKRNTKGNTKRNNQEKFQETIEEKIKSIVEDSTEPKMINQYIDSQISKINRMHSCVPESVAAKAKCDNDGLCSYGTSDKITLDNLKKCQNNLHSKSLLSCNTDNLMLDDYTKIRSDLKEHQSTLNHIATDVNINSLRQQNHIRDFYKYQDTMMETFNNELSKRLQKETFAEIGLNNKVIGDEEMKILYPSAVSDFYGKYNVRVGQYKLLWNCSIKLRSNRLTMYNTHGDIIILFDVKATPTEISKFPTTTIEINLKEKKLSDDKYQKFLGVSAEADSIRKELLDEQRKLLAQVLNLRDGQFYLFGSDGVYIMYDYKKSAVLYLDRVN